jgi:hypothetical protein
LEEHIAFIFRKINLAINQRESRALIDTYFHAILLGLFFGPEDGGGMFLRNAA